MLERIWRVINKFINLSFLGYFDKRFLKIDINIMFDKIQENDINFIIYNSRL